MSLHTRPLPFAVILVSVQGTKGDGQLLKKMTNRMSDFESQVSTQIQQLTQECTGLERKTSRRLVVAEGGTSFTSHLTLMVTLCKKSAPQGFKSLVRLVSQLSKGRY